MAFHVTLLRRLPAILREGLRPQVPTDMPGDVAAVYFFADRDAMEDGLTNWLGARFPDGEPLVAIEAELSGLPQAPGAGYEVLVTAVVPPPRLLRAFDPDTGAPVSLHHYEHKIPDSTER